MGKFGSRCSILRFHWNERNASSNPHLFQFKSLKDANNTFIVSHHPLLHCLFIFSCAQTIALNSSISFAIIGKFNRSNRFDSITKTINEMNNYKHTFYIFSELEIIRIHNVFFFAIINRIDWNWLGTVQSCFPDSHSSWQYHRRRNLLSYFTWQPSYTSRTLLRLWLI